MLFVVGGASRSGKTLLARRMLAKASVPWFSLDALRVGLTRGAPALGLDLNNDDLKEAERLWPVVSELIENILFWDLDYLIEGSCLVPRHLSDLIDRRRDKEIRVIFVGSPGLDPEEKLHQIDENPVGGNDWLKGEPHAVRLAHARRVVADSALLERLARDQGLAFFDTGQRFDAALDRALAHLLQGS